MRIKMLPGALVIAALVTLAISLGVATPNVYGGGDDSLPTLPEKPELKYPNLGSNLDQLVASVEKGETSAKEAAEDAPVHQEASVAVTIYLSGNVDDVVKFLEDNGGSPRNVGEDYIETYVPLSLLGQVSEQPGVIRVREIVPPEDNQSAQRVAGHGPPVHGSSAWNQAGFSGQGIKVGVIDSNFGFNDFMGLMGTELPSTVQARCYTDAGRFTSNVADCGNAILGDNHGTLLAEAVMDIAPEASLYIATPWSLGDLRTATDWMVSQGVSVIASGVVFNFDGPGDGTSPFSDSPLKTVDRAVAGGAIWVNGAGNYGQSTWFGTYSIVNVDGTKYVAFNGSDVFNDVALEVGDVITVQLRWEDSWSGTNRDFDLHIWDFATSTTVDYSFDPQQGRVGQVPFELLSYQVPRDGRYAVKVVHEGGSTPGWIQLTVWGVGSIEHYTESGSIANPAESSNPGMLAVGAAHWNKVRTIEHYSSRGPTPDRRVKPDIVGADCGATALRNGFCGTSQAAPHVAGMAALVRQRFPTYTAVQVANYLKEHAEQRESPDPNNTWGHGFAQLPPLSECSDAVPSAASNPGLVADCEALLAARDTLAGSADRGMYRVSCRGMAGDLQVGLGFRPGFGQQPYPAPEPAPVQQPPQPGNAVPDYADGPSRLLPATAVSGRQRPGRRSQAAGGQPPVIGVFHPGPVGQGQQRRHRQHEPMPRNPRRVSPAGLLPLPTQALDRLEPQLDPEAERVPTHPNFVRRKVGQDNPRLLLFNVPDRQQGATAFYCCLAERRPAPGPRGIRTGNEGARGQPPAALSAESDVFRIPHVGMPALSEYLFPQFRTGQSPVAQHNHGHVFWDRRGQGLQQFHYRVHPGPRFVGVQDAPGHGNRATPVDHADDDGGGVVPFQRRVNRQGQPVRTPPREDPSQEGREAEAHIQFGLAGTRPVAAVVEPFPKALPQIVPVSLGGESGGDGILAGAPGQDSPAHPQDQPGQL